LAPLVITASLFEVDPISGVGVVSA